MKDFFRNQSGAEFYEFKRKSQRNRKKRLSGLRPSKTPGDYMGPSGEIPKISLLKGNLLTES